MKYLVNISYDGKDFYGFQRQKTKRTVCGEIEKCLSKILNEEKEIKGVSRTDALVHALDFYFTFETDKKLDVNKFKKSLNSVISEDIYIKNIKLVDDKFHVRHDVKRKEYMYIINTSTYDPIRRNYVLNYNKYIDIKLLKKASKKLSGLHNFKSFTSDNEKDNYERNIKINIKKDKDYVYIYVLSTGFLRYMVRNIVGLLLEINEGKKSIDDIDKIFKSEDRRKNAKCASAHALYLNKVIY